MLFVLAMASAIAVALVYMKPKAKRQARHDTGYLVEVHPVTAQTLPMIVETFGTAAPRYPLNLVAEVPGQIVDYGRLFRGRGLFHQGHRAHANRPQDLPPGGGSSKRGIGPRPRPS